jgi:hypothetical protein
MDPQDSEYFEIVRPGLGHNDQGTDPADQVADQWTDKGSELRALIATIAPSPDRKKALSDLAVWDRQSRFLEALETTPGIVHACEASGVSKRTVNEWRQHDTLGFLVRMDGARESFADRLLALSWSLVQRLKPGQSPVLLLSMLNFYVAGFRPATAPEPMDARTTLAELRALSASTPALSVPTVSDAVAEAEAVVRDRFKQRLVDGPPGGPSAGPGTNSADLEG